MYTYTAPIDILVTLCEYVYVQLDYAFVLMLVYWKRNKPWSILTVWYCLFSGIHGHNELNTKNMNSSTYTIIASSVNARYEANTVTAPYVKMIPSYAPKIYY